MEHSDQRGRYTFHSSSLSPGVKHRLGSPHHQKLILTLLKLQLFLLQLHNMGMPRTFINLLQQLLYCLFHTLNFSLDLNKELKSAQSYTSAAKSRVRLLFHK
jgi:hypothetical protein